MINNNKIYKMLVIDDSSLMRRVLINLMQTVFNADCYEAGNGVEGLIVYKKIMPDIVTLDIDMPVMDGIATLTNLLGFDKNAKVVMLSTENEKEKTIRAITHGAKSYILKPVNSKNAVEEIKNALDI